MWLGRMWYSIWHFWWDGALRGGTSPYCVNLFIWIVSLFWVNVYCNIFSVVAYLNLFAFSQVQGHVPFFWTVTYFVDVHLTTHLILCCSRVRVEISVICKEFHHYLWPGRVIYSPVLAYHIHIVGTVVVQLHSFGGSHNKELLMTTLFWWPVRNCSIHLILPGIPYNNSSWSRSLCDVFLKTTQKSKYITSMFSITSTGGIWGRGNQTLRCAQRLKSGASQL